MTDYRFDAQKARTAALACWGTPANTINQPEPPADGEVAELVAWLRNEAKQHADSWPEASAKATRLADFLERLAEPEPVGPTDEELWALGNEDFRANCYPTDAIRYARAVLARWGRSTTQPEPMTPTDEELTLVYAYAVTAAVDNKRGPFKPEDAEAAQLAGLRAVLARWGNQS